MKASFLDVALCALILPAAWVFGVSFYEYHTASVLAGKRCSAPDLMFTLTTNSVAICATHCNMRYGCLSVFHNNETDTCYGCSRYFNAQTDLEDGLRTTHHYRDACPNDWSRGSASCYLFKNEDHNWEETLEYCKAQNASLVEINDADESYLLLSLPMFAGNTVWLGLNDRAVEGDYRWETSNASVTFDDWLQGFHKPDDPDNDEKDCVVYHPYGGWVDVPCSDQAKCACERAAAAMPFQPE